MRRVAVVDTGMGNLRSVERALHAAAALAGRPAAVTVTRDADALSRADHLVFPGQGAFRDCSAALEGGLAEALRASIDAGTPYLGICLGLQSLFETSDEAPGCEGLGVFAGKVARLVPPEGRTELKIPHVGWNRVDPSPRPTLLPQRPEYFYFVHSYVAVPADPAIVCGTTEHGVRFVSAIARANVFACQFHPEKSQRAGLELLARFLAL